MAELLLFGLEIFRVVRVWPDANGNLFNDFQAITFETDNFFGIIGEKANGFEAEINENLCAETVFAEVHSIAQLEVCLNGIETVLLQFVGPDLRGQADAATFLA